MQSLILYLGIGFFALVGVTTMVSRVWLQPEVVETQVLKLAQSNKPNASIALTKQERQSVFIEAELPLPDPQPDVVLPPDDGTHYLHAIALPFTVWDITHQSIAVYIDPQHPQYAVEVKQAFIAWQQASDHMFAFRFVTDPQLSDCAIGWAQHLAHHPQHPNAAYIAGLTESTHNNTFVLRNDITFTTQDPAENAVTSVALYNTAVHEIGHMLGLKGHSDQEVDVMAAISRDDGQRHAITHRDVKTLRVLYQPQTQAPRILTPPNILLAQFRQHHQLVDKAYDLDSQNRFAEAMATTSQAISLYAHNPDAHLLLANLYLRDHQFAKAKAVLQPWATKLALPMHQAIYSKYVVAYVMQANAYAESNQALKARQEAQMTLPKLARALQLPGLDVNIRQYLIKVQPALQQLADLPA